MGAKIYAEQEVTDVKPLDEDGTKGYEITYKPTFSPFGKKTKVKTKSVIFAGGVLGTMSLLLRLKKSSLHRLSSTLGNGVRTNSESLIGVTSFDKKANFSEGIAIGSILEIDENRHLEPVKYPEGSGFWRLLMAPMVSSNHAIARLVGMVVELITHPVKNFKAFFIDDWAKRTQILLYMESIDSTLRFARPFWGGLSSKMEKGKAPAAYNPVAQELAKKTEAIVNGKAMVLNTETLLGIPTTAHILGGACMGKDVTDGVIDDQNRVFNYQNMWICDGSMISANIGVNPSLTITALTERAMSFIPDKDPNS